MKKLFSGFVMSETTRRVLTYSMYTIFSIFTLYKLWQEPLLEGKICYGLILLVIVGISSWGEYLRVLYYKMLRAQSMDCDPAQAMIYYNKLAKLDIFKSYRSTLLIFDTLAFQDDNKPNDLLTLLKDFDQTFRSSLDFLLIRNFSTFYAYYKIGNRTKVKQYYPEVMQLQEKKIKGSKVSPLYNWQLIEAMYLQCDKQYKKSLEAYKNVDPKYMNNRELALYNLEFAKAYIQLQDFANASEKLAIVIELAPLLAYGKEAKEILSKL